MIAKWIQSKNVAFTYRVNTLCISLIEGKSPSRSEHLNGKIATISTFFQGTIANFTLKDALLL